MAAVNITIWEVVGSINGSRGHGGRQNKAVVGIHRSMLLEPIMGRIFLDDPVGIKVSIEF